MTTVEAWLAISKKSPQASTIWVDRLRSIDDNTVRQLLTEVPPNRLSQIGREFTARLLEENRQRILRGDEE